MDRVFHDALRTGLDAFGIVLPEGAEALLERYADRLLAWNRKVNLTSITAPAIAGSTRSESTTCFSATSAGAGLPGVPLACARRDLAVTCCDSVTKKVAFVKAVSAELGVDVRAVAVRAEGDPEREKLPRADAAISRAFADPEIWVPLGARYLAEGGVLVAMLGRGADRARLEALGAASGLRLDRLDVFELPLSRSARAVAAWRRA